MAMSEVPATKPPGVKNSAYWNWFIWFFEQFGTFPTSYYIDYNIADPVRFTNIASRKDGTAILVKYDHTAW